MTGRTDHGAKGVTMSGIQSVGRSVAVTHDVAQPGDRGVEPAKASAAAHEVASVPPGPLGVITFPVAPQDVGPWTGATRRVLHSPDVRESFYRLGMVAADAKLYWDVMADFAHDVANGGYRANRFGSIKRTFKFFTTPTHRLIPWIKELLEGNDRGAAHFAEHSADFEKSIAKGRLLGAGFGALLAVSSWNKLCRTMDNPRSTAFERSLRWVDFATSLLSCIPELPQMRLLSFSLAILTAVFEAAFWHNTGVVQGEPEANSAAGTSMLRALEARISEGSVPLGFSKPTKALSGGAERDATGNAVKSSKAPSEPLLVTPSISGSQPRLALPAPRRAAEDRGDIGSRPAPLTLTPSNGAEDHDDVTAVPLALTPSNATGDHDDVSTVAVGSPPSSAGPRPDESSADPDVHALASGPGEDLSPASVTTTS